MRADDPGQRHGPWPRRVANESIDVISRVVRLLVSRRAAPWSWLPQEERRPGPAGGTPFGTLNVSWRRRRWGCSASRRRIPLRNCRRRVDSRDAVAINGRPGGTSPGSLRRHRRCRPRRRHLSFAAPAPGGLPRRWESSGLHGSLGYVAVRNVKAARITAPSARSRYYSGRIPAASLSRRRRDDRSFGASPYGPFKGRKVTRRCKPSSKPGGHRWWGCW